MGDPLDIGPFRLSDFHLKPLDGNLHLEIKNLDLFSNKPASLSIGSADLHATIRADSHVKVPLLGLDGDGQYTLNLDRIRIRDNRLSARVQGKLRLGAGPLTVDAQVTTEGSTVIDDPIVLDHWREHLEKAGDRASADFRLRANLGLGPLVGSALLTGQTQGQMRGPMQFKGDLRLGPLALLDVKGGGDFAPGAFNLSGQFSGGLPPVLFTKGTYLFGLGEGLRLRGFTAGLLIPGVNDLGPGFKPTAPGLVPVPDHGGSIGLLEPGLVQFGMSLFDANISSGTRSILSVGVAPTSSVVPYESDGSSRPFAGPSTGTYVGGKLKLVF
jgi:hypothetical protein